MKEYVYVWYSPDFNVIVLQHTMDNCLTSFEWGWHDLTGLVEIYGDEIDPMWLTQWVPLGEL